jgi:hypothetical protein
MLRNCGNLLKVGRKYSSFAYETVVTKTSNYSNAGLYLFGNNNLKQYNFIKIGVSTDLINKLDSMNENDGRYVKQYLLYDNDLKLLSMLNIRMKLLSEFSFGSSMSFVDTYVNGYIELGDNESNNLNALKRRIKEELKDHNVKYYEFK